MQNVNSFSVMLFISAHKLPLPLNLTANIMSHINAHYLQGGVLSYCDATKILLVYISLHKNDTLSCLHYLLMDTLDTGAGKQNMISDK